MPYGILREVENAYLFIYLFTAHTLQIVKPPCVKKEELIKRPGPRVHSKIERVLYLKQSSKFMIAALQTHSL